MAATSNPARTEPPTWTAIKAQGILLYRIGRTRVYVMPDRQCWHVFPTRHPWDTPRIVNANDIPD